MPNIKLNRHFGIDSMGNVTLKYGPYLCWKCGKEIPIGSYGWTYNPRYKQSRSAGMYSHLDCSTSVITLPTEPPTKPTSTIPVEPILESEPIPEQPKPIAPPHILDAVTCGQKNMHYQCERIVRKLKQGKYPFLHGSPGAGKTTLVLQIAEAAKLEPVLIPCSPDMLRSEVIGNKSPLSGEYFPVPFYEAWKNGGVVLFDEVGLAPGSFLNMLNAALAQQELRFPSGERIQRNAHCFIVFADNSNLWGRDDQFPERQDAGAAFRDRLTYIKFEYDNTLQETILRNILGPIQGPRWHAYTIRVRAILETGNDGNRVGIFASPRFAIAGAIALRAGDTLEEVLEEALYQGLPNEVIEAIKREVNNVYYAV